MLCVADACPESITLPQSCLSCYRQGGASGGVQRPDAVETQETVEETVAEPIEEALERLEEELKALQQELEEERLKGFGERDFDVIEKLQAQIKTKQAEVEAKKAAIEKTRQVADEAELELKRKQLLDLEAQGNEAAGVSDMDYSTARLIQKRYRETKQELECLEQAKRARLAPADSGGGV